MAKTEPKQILVDEWHEYSGKHSCPHVDPDKFGPHVFDGDEDHTSDCAFGCGCWMGPSRSGGVEGVASPHGRCPKNIISAQYRISELKEQLRAAEHAQ